MDDAEINPISSDDQLEKEEDELANEEDEDLGDGVPPVE
jgi:hypothetical protein